MAPQAAGPKKGETMKKTRAAPASIPTPEQQLERMKELVREIITAPKGKVAPKRKAERRKRR